MFLSGLGILDIILSVLFSLAVLLWLFFSRQGRTQGYQKYLIPFVAFKILSATLFVVLHIYFYQGGDTFVYFQGGKYFVNLLVDSPVNGIKLLLSSNESLKDFPYDPIFNISYFFKANDIFFMSKLSSFICLISFNQFLTASILFSLLSATGIWKLYQTLCNLYPALYKYFAICVLFYPTIAIWGSGILKDPLTLSAIGFIFYSFHKLMQGKKVYLSILYILIAIYLCLKLKPYLLYIFIPTMLLWGQLRISRKIKSKFSRVLITPIILAIFGVGGFLLLDSISESAGKYSLENVEEVAKGFQSWHSHLANERQQSGYSLGNVEFTPSGILKKVPEALVVTYYRPFLLGDIRNIPTAFEGIQSFLLLIISIYVVLKVGFIRFLKLAYTDINVRAFLFFAIVLGAAVGLTSYNFGALSRYKIPCLPFFTSSLAIIYYYGYVKRKIKTYNAR